MWYVYFIQSASGYTKIGFSNDVETRLKSLQTANYEPLYIQAKIHVSSEKSARLIESMLHDRYADYRESGEWFSISLSEILDEISWSMRLISQIDGIERFETIERVYVEKRVREILTESTVSDFKPRNTPVYSGRGYTRKANAKQMVIDYLEANPDDILLTLRELSEKIGVGKSTVGNVIQEMKGNI